MYQSNLINDYLDTFFCYYNQNILQEEIKEKTGEEITPIPRGTPDGFDFELLLKDLDLIWELRKYIPIGPYR